MSVNIIGLAQAGQAGSRIIARTVEKDTLAGSGESEPRDIAIALCKG